MRLAQLPAALLALAFFCSAAFAALFVEWETEVAFVTSMLPMTYVTVTANDPASTVYVTRLSTSVEFGDNSTVFLATSYPNTLYSGTFISTIESLVTDQPLITDAPVASQDLETSIESSTISQGVTLTPGAQLTKGAQPTTSVSSYVYTSTSEVTSASTFSTEIAKPTTVTSTGVFTTVSGSSTTTFSSQWEESTSTTLTVETSSHVVSTSLVEVSTSSTVVLQPTGTPESESAYSGSLFEPIDVSEPPTVFPREELNFDLSGSVENDGHPIETNKFYANLFLGSQTQAAFVYPYNIWWDKTDNYGLAVAHTRHSQRVFGGTTAEGYPEYFFSPTGVSSVVFSSPDFEQGMDMTLTDLQQFSVNVKLSASNGGFVSAPLVQGMGLVTAQYSGLKASLKSKVGFKAVVSKSTKGNLQKYEATLFDGTLWVIYVTVPDGSGFSLDASGAYELVGSRTVDGLLVQVAATPEDSSADLSAIDSAAGAYPTSAELSGSVADGTSATYAIEYTVAGDSASGTVLVYALPHQVASLTDATAQAATGLQLDVTTKGVMSGYLTNRLEMAETLNRELQFLPSGSNSGDLQYSAEVLALLAETANSELSVDISAKVRLSSTYFSGKMLDKYAYILLVVSDVLQDKEVAQQTLAELKDAFAIFTSNEQTNPLMYDTKLGGITSSAGQSGDGLADFGSPYYNDHHFHYGYFVHAAAIVGYVDSKIGDGTWAAENAAWVNSLVRDVANPSMADSYFPVSRSFDWFAGHSWAKGLFESADGKDEESSSEDYNFAYGMKLWGQVIGDKSMEHRGDLMLAVMRRSMQMYFLFADGNSVQPSEFLPNRVTGIMFDNKVDHTTYFGNNEEYIHGIHMLPVTPASQLVRGSAFPEQEWQSTLASLVPQLNSGWLGVLRLNQALFDPTSSYEFFSQQGFSGDWLDDGLSRTWALAFSGGLM